MFKWIKNMFHGKVGNRFTDEDREKSKEILMLRYNQKRDLLNKQHELEMLRYQREILEIREEINDLGGDDFDLNGLLMQIITPILQKNFLGNTQIENPQSNTSPNNQTFSNEQLLALWQSIPPHIQKALRKMDETTLRATLKQRIPTMDEETVTRAISVINHV